VPRHSPAYRSPPTIAASLKLPPLFTGGIGGPNTMPRIAHGSLMSRGKASLWAPQIIDRLTSLYGIKWFDKPVRVDVVRVGKSQGAYTAVVPRVHIIVASADASYAGRAGTEMLFHESSHGLIQNVRAAVDQAMAAVGKNPRDLWHVVLFYITGEVTRQTLAARGIEYEPYLYATGLFARAWPMFRGPIEQTVRPFVDRKINLDEMARTLAASAP
jgi:hypothetical protein